MPSTEPPYWYEIEIREPIGEQSMSWFDGLSITSTFSGGTLLAGQVVDQPALHGILMLIRDLNLTLISVNRIERAKKE
jgi:hypothetical protein